MQELFSPLACGGKLVLAVPGGEKDTQYLARLKASQGVTFCIYVPSQLDAALQVIHAAGSITCVWQRAYVMSVLGHQESVW